MPENTSENTVSSQHGSVVLGDVYPNEAAPVGEGNEPLTENLTVGGSTVESDTATATGFASDENVYSEANKPAK